MIDVIVPIYNTNVDDLNRCFTSINMQDYDDYKVYLIDDGSSEEIASFLDQYANNHSKYNVIHEVNSGVSHARNNGIENSNSPYIAFVDSDDTIEKSFLREAFELITTNDLDLVIGGFNEINNGVVVSTRSSNNDLIIYDKSNMIEFIDKLISSKNTNDNNIIGNTPVGRTCTRLFKRDLIKNVKFNEKVSMSEDTLYMIEISKYISRLGIVNNIWYNYYQNDYSVTHNKIADKQVNKSLSFIYEIIRLINEESNPRIIKSLKYRIFKSIYNIEEYIDLVDEDTKNKIIDIFNKYVDEKIFDDYINVKEKEKSVYNKLLEK